MKNYNANAKKVNLDSFLCVEVSVLPERVHCQLLLCVVELGALGASHRLDGHERHQPAPRLHRPGGYLPEGTSNHNSVHYTF